MNEEINDLDPGIRPIVEALRARGIETFESCQGGKDHACPEPMVRFYGEHSEGFKAFAVAQEAGLPVLTLRRIWDIHNREPCGPYWEMTFKLN